MTITKTSQHIEVPEHTGTWHCIDEYKKYFLLEHEVYGKETEHIVVDETGFKVFGEIYDDNWTKEVDDWLICGDSDPLVEKFLAIVASGLVEFNDIYALRNFIDEDNLARFSLIYASDAAELGRYWAEEDPDVIPEGITPEEYGRVCVKEENGVFTEWGYIYERERASVREYSEPAPVAAAPPDIDLLAAATKFAKWQDRVSENPADWREDERFRKAGDGAFYYAGRESGQYIHVRNNGMLELGTYAGASPGIADSVKTFGSQHQFSSYEEASIMAAQIGGHRFLSDVFGGAARLAALMDERRGGVPVMPHERPKIEMERKDGFVSVIGTIEKTRNVQSQPRKAEGAAQKNKGGEEI